MLVKYHHLKLANRLEENALNDTDFTASLLLRSLKLEYTRVVECGPVPQGAILKQFVDHYPKQAHYSGQACVFQ